MSESNDDIKMIIPRLMTENAPISPEHSLIKKEIPRSKAAGNHNSVKY